MLRIVIDDRGKRCPIPVVSLGHAWQIVADESASESGGSRSSVIIEVWADDPAAAVDIPAWCRMRGASFVDSKCLSGNTNAYLVRFDRRGPRTDLTGTD